MLQITKQPKLSNVFVTVVVSVLPVVSGNAEHDPIRNRSMWISQSSIYLSATFLKCFYRVRLNLSTISVYWGCKAVIQDFRIPSLEYRRFGISTLVRLQVYRCTVSGNPLIGEQIRNSSRTQAWNRLDLQQCAIHFVTD